MAQARRAGRDGATRGGPSWQDEEKGNREDGDVGKGVGRTRRDGTG